MLILERILTFVKLINNLLTSAVNKTCVDLFRVYLKSKTRNFRLNWIQVPFNRLHKFRGGHVRSFSLTEITVRNKVLCDRRIKDSLDVFIR